MKLKTVSAIAALALAAGVVTPSAQAQTRPGGNQVPGFQSQIGVILQNVRGPAAANAILAAYARAVRANPSQAARLVRIANNQILRLIPVAQRPSFALRMSQVTAGAFAQRGIAASSPLYLQTFPFIANIVPTTLRTEEFLLQIANTAEFANESAGGTPEGAVEVVTEILGTGGFTPPPPVS